MIQTILYPLLTVFANGKNGKIVSSGLADVEDMGDELVKGCYTGINPAEENLRGFESRITKAENHVNPLIRKIMVQKDIQLQTKYNKNKISINRLNCFAYG